MIDRYTINGLVELNGRLYWRIDDLASNATEPAFMRKPAALILATGEADDKSQALAARVVAEMNRASQERDRETLCPTCCNVRPVKVEHGQYRCVTCGTPVAEETTRVKP